MSKALVLSDWQKRSDGDTTTISAMVGQDRLWFSGPLLANTTESGDPWVAFSLIPAMAMGATLDLRDLPPVSKAMLDNARQMQEIWTAWNPELKGVDLLANTVESHQGALDRTATFFSGGADAIHGVLDGAGPGELLVYIDGFDYMLDDEALAKIERRLRLLADPLQGELEMLRTNQLQWGRELRLSGLLTFGGVLSGIGHLIGVRRMTISSSYTWSDLRPIGSHPLVDPLWSTDATEIRHWGCSTTRAEKLAQISQRPDLLAGLHVCHKQESGHCGNCPKCIRTRTVLNMLGSELPELNGDAHPRPIERFVKNLSLGSESSYLSECIDLADSLGDSEIVRALEAGANALDRRRVVRDIRRRLLPGRARRRDLKTDLWPWGRGPNPERL